MNTLGQPTALVVWESLFGNTRTIARAVADGLALEGFVVRQTEVAQAPALAGVLDDLVVAGGPTHAFSLSRPATREDAVRQGADRARARTGLREWLLAPIPSDAPARRPLVAVFDTRASQVRLLPASASHRAGRILSHRGYEVLDRPTGFVVHDVTGPLQDGEAGRATAWGRNLAREAQQRLVAASR